MAIQKGDFIEINYTGRIADSKEVFDTTIEEVAKKENINSKQNKYGSIIIAVGERHVIPGIDAQLIGKELGSYTFEVADVDAFGKKNAKLLKLVPTKKFTAEGIRPFVGMQVNIDDEMGIVRSISGGRIIVDFNHPLSSKDLEYDVEVIRIVTDKKEQVSAFFNLMGFKADNIEVKDKTVIITTKMLLPQEITQPLTADIKRLTSLETITFEAKDDKKPPVKSADIKPTEVKTKTTE